jgi:hypothetical protein
MHELGLRSSIVDAIERRAASERRRWTLPRCNSWAGQDDELEVSKFIAIVAPDEADAALAALRGHPLGRDAVKIGDIREEPPGIVVLLTPIGGTRIVDMLVGDPLPRTC